MPKNESIGLFLNFADDKAISNELAIYGAAGKKALQRAIRKFIRRKAYQVKRALAAQSSIPQKVLKKRMFIDISFPYPGIARGRIWVGLNPIAFNRLGSMRQLRKAGGGVRAGKHFAKGAFIHKDRVFKRKGRAPRPIAPVSLDIKDESMRILNKIAFSNTAKITKEFKIIFDRELNYVLNYEKPKKYA